MKTDDLALVIGRKIDELRVSKGLKKTEMAKMLGVTRQTLDNYIRGKQIIDSAKLAALARYLNKSMDYFLSPDTDTDNRFSLMFRAENASEAPPEILDRILRYFELYLDLLDSVDRKVVFNPPTYSVRINQQNLTAAAKREIENIAAKCRQVCSTLMNR